MQIEVMVTKTWAYFQSQLDRARKIKAHVLIAGTNRSYCGLQNHDDVGQMSWQEFLDLDVDACTRCRHLTKRAGNKKIGNYIPSSKSQKG